MCETREWSKQYKNGVNKEFRCLFFFFLLHCNDGRKIVNMPTFYKAEINKTEWEVPDRYQMLSPVGSGAYGQVWWVVQVAVRSLRDNFSSTHEKTGCFIEGHSHECQMSCGTSVIDELIYVRCILWQNAVTLVAVNTWFIAHQATFNHYLSIITYVR